MRFCLTANHNGYAICLKKSIKNINLLLLLTGALLGLAACEKKIAVDPDYENLKRADSFITQGNLSAARIELLNALQINAKNPKAFLLLADIYQMLGLYRQAAEELRRAQSLNQDSSTAMQLKIHRMLVMAGDSSAKEDLSKLQMTKEEQTLEKQVLLGRIYFIDNELEKATHLFKQVINTENPFRAEAYFGLANIAQKTGSIGQAIALMDKSLTIDPNNTEALLARGQLYLHTGENAKAEDFYTKAMMGLKQLDVMTVQKYIALSGLVEALNRQSKTEQAIQYSEILAKSRPGKLKSNYENALTALASKDIEKARASLENILEIVPHHPQSNYIAGMMEIKEGDLENAEKHLSRALAGEPVSDQIRTALIITRLKLKQYANAEKLITEALHTSPDSPVYLSLRGAYFAATGEFQKAENSFLTALQNDSRFLPAISELANLYASNNKLEEAEEYIDRGIKIAPENIELLMTKVKYASKNNTLTQVKTQLLNLHQSQANLIAPPLVLAAVYLNEKNLDLATRYLDKATAINSKHPLLANLKSNISITKAMNFIADNKPEEALLSLDQALLDQPKNLRAQILKADLLTKQGDSKAALDIGRNLQSNPKTKLIGYELTGNILAQQAQFEQAVEAYTHVWQSEKNPGLALKIYRIKKEYTDQAKASEHLENWLQEDPKNFYAITSLATTSSESKDFHKAAMLYEKALEISKDNPILLNNLAYAYDELQDSKALPTAEQAYRLAPENAAIADTYGWILVRNELFEKALPILAKAAETEPKNKEILQHYSVALTKTGNNEKAKEVMKKITQL